MEKILVEREVVKKLNKESVKVDKKVFSIRERIIMIIFKKTIQKICDYTRVEVTNSLFK